MIQGLTQEQVRDIIYVGTFFYEALLREENLIDDATNAISGSVPYARWENYMRSGFGQENLSLISRYLPNAYIRSKATLLGTLTLSRDAKEFDVWCASVLSGLNDDESNKVEPYLREVFETAQKLVLESRKTSRDVPTSVPRTQIMMNRNQRIAVIAGAIVFVIMLLVPPWRLGGGRPGGYHLLFWPPDRNISIDFARLFVQCLLVTAVTAGGFLLLKSKH